MIQKTITKYITVRWVGFLLLFVAISLGVLGFINQHSGLYVPSFFMGDFYANLSTELASIAITILIIDGLNKQRAIQQEKDRLVLQMGSPVNSVSREAVRLLRAHSWLVDGSTQGKNFSWANWENCYLEDANLAGTDLYRVNMKGALFHGVNLHEAKRLEDGQLIQLYALDGAIMPDGSRYDGRYNLTGDLWWSYEIKGIDPNDTQSMAKRYGVSHEIYLAGQEWAKNNLNRIQQELVLDSERRGVSGYGHKPISFYFSPERSPNMLLKSLNMRPYIGLAVVIASGLLAWLFRGKKLN